ncbi:hypothetical protein, partial [Photorhabdus khanii]|uniref:hypothetical protein n=1 Tax=Photorhabdus khanii TaxID=1004150 RepID=UPI001863B693
GCPPDSDGVDARHRQRMVLKILTFQIVEHGIGGRRAFGLWRGVALSAVPGVVGTLRGPGPQPGHHQ